MSQPSDLPHNSFSSQSQPLDTEKDNWSSKNFESSVRLIDSLIPKNACMRYQILPISLIEGCLTLGMVNLRNQEAIEYVRSLLPQKDYKLKVEPLALKTLQLIISTHNELSRPTKEAKNDPASGDRQTPEGINEQPTLIVDRPHELTLLETDAVSATASPSKPAPMPFPPPLPPNFNEQPTFIVDNPNEVASDLAPKSDSPEPNRVLAADSTNVEPSFTIQNHNSKESFGFLANLPPNKLWQELFSRTIRQGIGRLYFERHPNHGRIFWSQNGLLQLSLEKITPSLFQAILNEFKRIMRLPPAPVKQVRKGELERKYDKEALLIRWQITPGKYGEEGTLQVLRGEATQLYQQRQIKELGNQALRIAEDLENKLKQIQALPQVDSARLESLPALRKLLDKINRQIESLEKD
jgi:type II secretory ATPase GspE/PulE/Tfp pilus assembly ATPase PilB-like protein